MKVRILGRFTRIRVKGMLREDLDGLNQSLALEESHLPKLMRFSIALLSLATFGFIGWAAITPVKELARIEGQVVPTGYSQLVQHLEGGLVQEILIREGDFVEQNQLLVRLDGAGTEEDLREQELLVAALSLHAERLQASIQNREPDFSSITALPAQIKEQTLMYNTMREAREGERKVLEEQVAYRRETIGRLRQLLATAQANLEVAKESRAIYEDLAQKGMAARTAYLARQQEYNSRQGDVANYQRQIAEAQTEYNEYKRRLETLGAQQRDNTFNELHRVEAELAQAREMLKKRGGRYARLEVRSPVRGYVKGLKLNTIGAVIPAGQTLMEIVPVEERLVVEVRIAPEQIGRIAAGQVVQVKVDSYDYVRFGTIEGMLESISAMTFTDESRRQEYYKGRVRLSRNFAGLVPDMHKIIPGMTVDADIVTGEKTVLAYLLKPIRSALYNAMTEQ